MRPKESTIKRLFARSHNQCAFPECVQQLVLDSGVVVGDICHIKAEKAGGPRYDVAQTDEERHAGPNLILLCANHHREVDGDTSTYPVEHLTAMKAAHEDGSITEITPKHGTCAHGLLVRYEQQITVTNNSGQVAVNSPGAIQAGAGSKFQFGEKKTKPKRAVIPETVGSSAEHRGYIKYLVKRYNKYQKADWTGKGDYKYIAIYDAIEEEMGYPWDDVPLERFAALVEFIQMRIDKTIIGRNNCSKGHANYHSFEEHLDIQANGKRKAKKGRGTKS